MMTLLLNHCFSYHLHVLILILDLNLLKVKEIFYLVSITFWTFLMRQMNCHRLNLLGCFLEESYVFLVHSSRCLIFRFLIFLRLQPLLVLAQLQAQLVFNLRQD